LEGPFAGIAPDIQQLFGPALKHDRQCFGKRVIGIVMIERVPARPRLARKLEQPLVDRIPIAEMSQPLRLAFFERRVQILRSVITYIAHEIRIDAGHRVVQEKMPQLGEEIMLVAAIYQLYAKSRFEQDPYRITRQTDLLRYRIQGDPFFS